MRGQVKIIKVNLAATLAMLDEADQVLDLGEIREGRAILATLGQMLRDKAEAASSRKWARARKSRRRAGGG